jgi:hypothetical protein
MLIINWNNQKEKWEIPLKNWKEQILKVEKEALKILNLQFLEAQAIKTEKPIYLKV